ncbi:MAG: hemerythrin domain-containing protein [Gammaproteobacteria bacterium]|nr:hemerythrin domain-containing protein [Gammaproteobacteria bacterium]
MQITDFMGDDHRRCDTIFAAAEESVSKGDWSLAEKNNRRFIDAMEHHFRMEEEFLFPRFEEVSGQTMGPTEMMRHEHQQMRQLFEQMNRAAASQLADDYLGASETLLILMQQHNAKEEQMLYPMSDQVLAGEQDELINRLEAVE